MASTLGLLTSRYIYIPCIQVKDRGHQLKCKLRPSERQTFRYINTSTKIAVPILIWWIDTYVTSALDNLSSTGQMIYTKKWVSLRYVCRNKVKFKLLYLHVQRTRAYPSVPLLSYEIPMLVPYQFSAKRRRYVAGCCRLDPGVAAPWCGSEQLAKAAPQPARPGPHPTRGGAHHRHQPKLQHGILFHDHLSVTKQKRKCRHVDEISSLAAP